MMKNIKKSLISFLQKWNQTNYTSPCQVVALHLYPHATAYYSTSSEC